MLRNRNLTLTLFAIALLTLAGMPALAQSTSSAPAEKTQSATSAPAEIPPTKISADLGACTAQITVTDKDNKPVYEAKVTARVRYGFMATKKVDLEVYSSANGQVKFIGLPAVPKKPVYFYVSKDDKLEIVEFRPDVACQAVYDVKFK